jgi:hypothetical protein
MKITELREHDIKVRDKIWVCVVFVNDKYTGLKSHLRPIEATVTGIGTGNRMIYFETGNKSFDESRYGQQNLWLHGNAAFSEEEIISIYNIRLEEAAQECKDGMSNKYSKSYREGIANTILKHKRNISIR